MHTPRPRFGGDNSAAVLMAFRVITYIGVGAMMIAVLGQDCGVGR